MATDLFQRLMAGIVAATALGGLVWAVWSTLFHQHAQRLRIVDLATKRLTFWDQFLNVALLATATDGDEQKERKAETYRAIQRVRSDADRDLQRLSWKSSTWERLLHEYPSFTQFLKFVIFPGKAPSASVRFQWYLYIVLFWTFFLDALYIAGVVLYYRSVPPVHPENIRSLKDGVGLAAVWVLSYVAGDFRKAAELLKYPQPKFKFMDQI